MERQHRYPVSWRFTIHIGMLKFQKSLVAKHTLKLCLISISQIDETADPLFMQQTYEYPSERTLGDADQRDPLIFQLSPREVE